ALIDFENRKSIFPAIDSRMKFCILSMTGTNIDQPVATFGFFLHDPAELADSGKTFSLTADEINLLNPNTGTCPVFRSRRDAEITLGIYERVPVLRDESKGANGNSWGISFLRMFDMSHESHLFRPDIQNGESFDDLLKDGWRLEGNLLVRGKERLLPLYEAKMADFYNHRVADVVKSETATKRQNQPRYLTERDLDDPDRLPLPSNWVPESDVIIAGRPYKGVAKRLFDQGWDSKWLLGWRDITSATNERTAIVGPIPYAGVGNSLPVSIVKNSLTKFAPALCAAAASMVFDFVARFKVGGTHLNFFITYQLPVPSPEQVEPHLTFITRRVIELTYTAYDMTPFARELGDTGAPFRWDDNRRAIIRAELDALFFHLYGISRDNVSYILSTFPIVKRKDEEKYGEYRTKNLILAEYDRM